MNGCKKVTFIGWYARLLSHYPFIVLLGVLVLVATCLIVIFTAGHGLDFDDPLAGFEPRGTEVSDRLVTFDNLVNNVGRKANLLPFATHIQPAEKAQELLSHRSAKRSPAAPELFSHRSAKRSPPVESLGSTKRSPPTPNKAVHSKEQFSSRLRTQNTLPALDVSLSSGDAELMTEKITAGDGVGMTPALQTPDSSITPGDPTLPTQKIIAGDEAGGKPAAGRSGKDGASQRRKGKKRKKNRERGRKRGKKRKGKNWRAGNRDSRLKSAGKNARKSKGLALCGVPEKQYSRLVVTSSHGRSLFNPDDLKAMCQLEESYFQAWPRYTDFCFMDTNTGQCCLASSLGNYVALLAGKARCQDITSDDVTDVHALLSQCAPFFHNFTLGPNCSGRKTGEEWYFSQTHPAPTCRGVPKLCTRYNAVYHILYFLSDSSFMYPDASLHSSPPGHAMSLGRSESFLKFSTIFLPMYAGPDSVDVFDHVNSLPRTVRGVTVVGAFFANAKYTLFERYMVSDSIWIGLACGVIFIGMWLYTSSFFVTLMAFLSIFWSVGVAYFLYTFVFKIKFFPYMNMVTLIVMVGVGADDLFIYCKVWNLAKAEKNNGVLEKIVSDTLRHTALSMFVSSLTSAAAFYANYISDITSIRCFSVFAGTCIVINFVLTVTWLPASIMLHERWLRCCVGLSERHAAATTACACLSALPYKLYFLVCDWSRIFFEKILPCLVIKFRFLWIALFGGLWVASVVVVFYYPRLKLPSSRKFQVFSSDHLLERYDFEFSKLFHFENMERKNDIPTFPITVVWGLLATDTGDHLDPYNKGSLTFDQEFDLTSPNAQRWILDFCSRIRRADFYKSMPGSYLVNCFMENFVHGWMKQPCAGENLECCNQTSFPYPKAVFMRCLSDYIPELKATPGMHYDNRFPGPRFSNGRISAFFVQFHSNRTYSHSYTEAESFYMHVNSWVRNEMRQAPPEMSRGWFVSSLQFYSLQASLAMGTPLTLGVSLSVVALMAFLTTLNILVSLYAMLAVGGAISSTLAVLVLLGWTLNVLESVVITIAVGLAVDLMLHYGVAYRLAPDTGRELRVISSLSRMGSPVSMATVTTMLAGALMMPSTVLAYRKFGTFLLLLVSMAWLYATFFLQALLRVAGPHGGFGQFDWPASDCCDPRGSRDRVDKTIYALSESTLSSSSTSTREHSSHGHSYVYTQELEPLTGARDRPCSRHYCHKHQHHHQSSHAGVVVCNNRREIDSCLGSTDSCSELKQQSSHRLRPHQRNHNHHHHHHHHTQNARARPRCKGSYTPVHISADVIYTKEEALEKGSDLAPSNTSSPSQTPEKNGRISPLVSPAGQTTDVHHCTSSLACLEKNQTESNGRGPAVSPAHLEADSLSMPPSAQDIIPSPICVISPSPHDTNPATLRLTQPSPYDNIVPSLSQNNILSGTNGTHSSSTLSPSPKHARLSSSDLSSQASESLSDQKPPVGSDSEPVLVSGLGSSPPSSTAKVELLPHTQPLTVS